MPEPVEEPATSGPAAAGSAQGMGEARSESAGQANATESNKVRTKAWWHRVGGWFARRVGPWFGAYVLLLLTFGFSAWQISRGSEDANLVAAFAVAITIITALIQTSLPLKDTVLATCAAGVTVVVGAFGIVAYRDHQPLDVSDEVTLDASAQGMRIRGEEAVVTVHLPRKRPHLGITFDLTDHDPGGSCAIAGQTVLQIRLNHNGNIRKLAGPHGPSTSPPVQPPLSPGQELTIDISPQVRDIRLQVMLLNQYDPKCWMNLSVTGARAY